MKVQLVKCLYGTLRTRMMHPKTHVKSRALLIPVLRKKRQEDLWGLRAASLANWKIHFNERSCLEK